ncbi:Crp/Fnr family transcriptional regulator [Candidatus Saccharibacteria bacterium]|nr:Crp/Fnr family transcriptional regulator [Candidatus Saccharibacteria bacterium]
MIDYLDQLLPISTQRLIKKSAILIYQGEVPRQAYVLLEGVVKVYRLDKFGNEQIINFHVAGDVFPATWVFGKTSSALFYYEALEDAKILTIERSRFMEIAERDPKIHNYLFDSFISNYTALLLQINALEQSRATEKIAMMLYYLMFRFGKEGKPGEFTIDFKLTHTTLGNLVGLTRETTNVELTKLRKKDIVSYENSNFTIYRQPLEQFLGSESFLDLGLKR